MGAAGSSPFWFGGQFTILIAMKLVEVSKKLYFSPEKNSYLMQPIKKQEIWRVLIKLYNVLSFNIHILRFGYYNPMLVKDTHKYVQWCFVY